MISDLNFLVFLKGSRLKSKRDPFKSNKLYKQLLQLMKKLKK